MVDFGLWVGQERTLLTFGVLALAWQVIFGIGVKEIPPVTLSVVAVVTAIYGGIIDTGENSRDVRY